VFVVAALFRSLFVDQLDVASTCHKSLQSIGLIAAFICSSNVALGTQTTKSTSFNETDSAASAVGISGKSSTSTTHTWPPTLATKIYVQTVLLAASVVLYAAAEYTLPRRSRPLTAVHHTDKLQRRVAVEIATSSSATNWHKTSQVQGHRIMSVDNISLMVLSSSGGSTDCRRDTDVMKSNERTGRIDV